MILSENIRKYMEFKRDLERVRKAGGAGTNEEEDILCDMDNLWWRMSDAEQSQLNEIQPGEQS